MSISTDFAKVSPLRYLGRLNGTVNRAVFNGNLCVAARRAD